jgi:hypothetical protein
MMSYKMETMVEVNHDIKRSVRSYKTMDNAKKNMAEWVKELDKRKAAGYLDAYHVRLTYENKEIDKVEA